MPADRATPDESWLARPLFDLFAQAVSRHADNVALADAGLVLSYRDVMERVTALAAAIAARTLPAAPVAVLMGHVAAQPVAVMACLAAGRVCLPLDGGAPAARNAAILADAGAQAVITLAGARPTLPDPAPPIIAVRADGLPIDANGGPFRAMPADPMAPALVIFTSGSTGTPKGIVLNQQAMTHQVLLDIESCALVAGDRYLAPLSPGTISPLRRLCAAWSTGGALHVVDVRRAGLGGVLTRLHAGRISVAAIFPSLLRAMVQLPAARAAYTNLRVLRVGGEALDWAEVAALRSVLPEACLILFAYGSTEMSPVVENPIGAGAHPAAGPVACGWPMPRCDLVLEAEDGRPAAPGEAGEAVLRSRYMASGHWRDGACVPGPFRPDPAMPGARIFRTGDLLRKRGDGAYEFVGRVDRQIKIRGNRVEPGETEAFLRRQPGIADAAVVAHGRPDAVILTAFVVRTDATAAPDPDPVLLRALRDALAELPASQRPARIRVTARIPYLPSFKPDLAALGALLAD